MKTKKLTALMSALMIAVCAVPMGANAENLMGVTTLSTERTAIYFTTILVALQPKI